MRTESVKYNYHYCKGSVCQKYQNKDMLTLTAFGVWHYLAQKHKLLTWYKIGHDGLKVTH